MLPDSLRAVYYYWHFDGLRAMIATRLATLGHGGDRKSDQGARMRLEVTQAEVAERLGGGDLI